MGRIDPEAAAAVEPELVSGETVVWAGRPTPGTIVRKRELLLVPFSLLWGGTAVLWEALAIGRRHLLVGARRGTFATLLLRTRVCGRQHHRRQLARLRTEEFLPGNAPADLRTVARHCQAEDPAGRYGSAAELLEDIRRWREGFPVRARRATAWYTLGRFVRRQWAILVLTGSLIGALGYGWAVARQGEQRARELAAEAQRQAALARIKRRRRPPERNPGQELRAAGPESPVVRRLSAQGQAFRALLFGK